MVINVLDFIPEELGLEEDVTAFVKAAVDYARPYFFWLGAEGEPAVLFPATRRR